LQVIRELRSCRLSPAVTSFLGAIFAAEVVNHTPVNVSATAPLGPPL
jgi:hypothetical protein